MPLFISSLRNGKTVKFETVDRDCSDETEDDDDDFGSPWLTDEEVVKIMGNPYVLLTNEEYTKLLERIHSLEKMVFGKTM